MTEADPVSESRIILNSDKTTGSGERKWDPCSARSLTRLFWKVSLGFAPQFSSQLPSAYCPFNYSLNIVPFGGIYIQ
jgi:hypothetical protein